MKRPSESLAKFRQYQEKTLRDDAVIKDRHDITPDPEYVSSLAVSIHMLETQIARLKERLIKVVELLTDRFKLNGSCGLLPQIYQKVRRTTLPYVCSKLEHLPWPTKL